MSAIGLLTVKRSGDVELKIITVSGGYNISTIADNIRRSVRRLDRLPEPHEAYEIALKSKFGDKNSLVVMDKGVVYGNVFKKIPKRYRRTFQQPRFNPHHEDGKADYIEVIEV